MHVLTFVEKKWAFMKPTSVLALLLLFLIGEPSLAEMRKGLPFRGLRRLVRKEVRFRLRVREGRLDSG